MVHVLPNAKYLQLWELKLSHLETKIARNYGSRTTADGCITIRDHVTIVLFVNGGISTYVTRNANFCPRLTNRRMVQMPVFFRHVENSLRLWDANHYDVWALSPLTSFVTRSGYTPNRTPSYPLGCEQDNFRRDVDKIHLSPFGIYLEQFRAV